MLMDYTHFLCIVFWSQYAAAVVFNLMLFLIIHHRGSRNGHFRYFHYFCIVMTLLYNFGSACVVPYSYFHDGLICWIPLAPWNNITVLIKIAFLLWMSGFEWTLIAVTTGFVFRYALICSPFILSFFIRPRRWPLIIILLLITYLYYCTLIFFILPSGDDMRPSIAEALSSKFPLDYDTVVFMGVDMKDEIQFNQSMKGIVMISFFMQTLIIMTIFTGWRIHKKIKVNSFSTRTKNTHSQALKLLIAQALNPVVFLYTTSFYQQLLITKGESMSSTQAFIISIIPNFYAIVNPLLILYYTDDYRKHVNILASNSRGVTIAPSVHSISVKPT